MPELDSYLADDEEVEFVTNRHITVLVRPFAWILVALVFALLLGLLARQGRGEEILDAIAAALVGSAALYFLAEVYRWRAEEVALTDRRLLEQSGLWRKRVTSIPYSRILSVALDRRLGARLLRAGDVIVDMGDRGRVRVAHLPRAKGFYRRLIALSSEERPRRLRSADREDTDPRGPLPRERF